MPRSTRSKGSALPSAKTRRSGSAEVVPRVRTDKLSVSLGNEDVVWVTRRAKRLGTSVSSVIASALAEQRRAEARDTLLELLGHDDLNEAAVAAARKEAFEG